MTPGDGWWHDDGPRADRRGSLAFEAVFPALGAVLALAGAFNPDDEEAIQIYLLAITAWIAWSLSLVRRTRPSPPGARAIGMVLVAAVVIVVIAEEATISDTYTREGTARTAALCGLLLLSGWLARRGG
jgi:hypothetical protein